MPCEGLDLTVAMSMQRTMCSADLINIFFTRVRVNFIQMVLFPFLIKLIIHVFCINWRS